MNQTKLHWKWEIINYRRGWLKLNFFLFFLRFVCCLPHVHTLQRAIDKCSTGMSAVCVYVHYTTNDVKQRITRKTDDNGSSEIGKTRPRSEHRTGQGNTIMYLLFIWIEQLIINSFNLHMNKDCKWSEEYSNTPSWEKKTNKQRSRPTCEAVAR